MWDNGVLIYSTILRTCRKNDWNLITGGVRGGRGGGGGCGGGGYYNSAGFTQMLITVAANNDL